MLLWVGSLADRERHVLSQVCAKSPYGKPPCSFSNDPELPQEASCNYKRWMISLFYPPLFSALVRNLPNSARAQPFGNRTLYLGTHSTDNPKTRTSCSPRTIERLRTPRKRTACPTMAHQQPPKDALPPTPKSLPIARFPGTTRPT